MATSRKQQPAARTTCPGCQASWTALGAAHCSQAGCHRTFVDTTLFDAHRATRGDHGACLDPTALVTDRRSKFPGQPLMEFRDGMWRRAELDRNCANTEGRLESGTVQVHNLKHCSSATEDIPRTPRAVRAVAHPPRGGMEEMAQRTEVKLLDDLARHENGEDVIADVTTKFGLDGKVYEIDLTKENDEELRGALAPFIAAARASKPVAVGARRQAATTSHDRLNREQSQAIREWARGRGMEVSERGRIPAEIRQAFDQAHTAE